MELLFAGTAIVVCVLWGVFFVMGFVRSPFIPTSKKATHTIMHTLGSCRGLRITDLGSGTGNLVKEAAKKGAVATGYEISFLLYGISLITTPKKYRVRYVRGDIHAAHLQKEDVVLCYLLPKEVARLEKKLEKEMKNGSRVISASFPMPHWKPEKIVPVGGMVKHIFVYHMPPKKVE